MSLKKKLASAVCLAALTAAGAVAIDAGPAPAMAQQNGLGNNGLQSFSEKSFTRPSEEVDLDFSAPGLVNKVAVNEGDVVKKGQLLAQQDVSVEEANKRMYEIEANSTIEEEYAVKDLELKRNNYQKEEDLFQKKNSSFFQKEEARLEMERADASVKLAKQKRAVAQAQAATEQAKIDLKKIVAPFDGIVSKRDTHPGEVATNQADQPAFRLVRNDPLWVDAHLPAAAAARLKPGQKLDVSYVGENAKVPAEVLYVQPVVRPGSQTRMVRLQMPNPDERPAGLEVFVTLPDGAVAAAAEAGGDSAPQPRAGADR